MVQAAGGGGHPSADPGGGVQRCALWIKNIHLVTLSL
jgi:hypothetical protein